MDAQMDANKTYEEKAWRRWDKNPVNCIEQVLEATLHKIATARPLTTHQENYQS